jgi:hypothetical protein
MMMASTTSCGLEAKMAQALLSNNYSTAGSSSSAGMRTRRVSSSALYEVRRKEQNDVCYLFVPDEYVSGIVILGVLRECSLCHN